MAHGHLINVCFILKNSIKSDASHIGQHCDLTSSNQMCSNPVNQDAKQINEYLNRPVLKRPLIFKFFSYSIREWWLGYQ